MNPDDTRNALSGAALVVSFLALLVTIINFRKSMISGRRPVLVFEYTGGGGWHIRNIGTGPAMNVVVAQKRTDLGWFNPVRVPPLAKDGTFVLHWCLHTNDTGLGATYEDTEGVTYTSICGNDLSTTRSGKRLPTWKEEAIGRHWSQPVYKPKSA
jgi:hypothetical protein